MKFYPSFISDPGWFNNVLKEYTSFRITVHALGLIQIRPHACTVILKLMYSFRTLLNQPGSEIKLR